jgi:hypothetical protein
MHRLFLDVSTEYVSSPLADGFLVRFLADSQGCIFWYLYQRPDSSDHCVVASQGFYGAPSEQWQDYAADPSQVVFVEQSFEAFVCRFWLENEIWFSGYAKSKLIPEGQQYLAQYGNGV